MIDESNSTARGVTAGVFLISMASLGLEVLQMRIFAYALWHHLAFLVISIAILGFAAAGAFLSATPRLRAGNLGNSVAIAGLLFALTAPLGPLFVANKRIDIFLQVGREEVLSAGLYYLLFAAPYFFAGFVISIVFTRLSGKVGKLYFLNMVGSGFGCFLIFATLSPLGAAGTVTVISAVGALVALLAAETKSIRVASVVLLVGFLGGTFIAEDLLALKPAESKLLSRAQQLGQTIKFSEWTPLCRIDITVDEERGTSHLFQDGDAPSLFPRGGNSAPPGSIHTIAYQLLEEPKVLVIGAGGGKDVIAAIREGARDATGIEINPTTHELSQDPDFSSASLVVEQAPSARLLNAEGRYYVRNSEESYDLIQMTGVDTYTALASGAYVMSESYLYTREAMHDYLDHLSEDGLVSIVRFSFPAPRETLRMMVLACTALKERGVAEPWKHVVIMKRGKVPGSDSPVTTMTSMGSILIKKKAFTQAELDGLRAYAVEWNMLQDYLPDGSGKFSAEELHALEGLLETSPSLQEYQLDESGMNPFHTYARALQEGKEAEFLDEYPYDVSAVSDDSPFFFNQHKLSSLVDWALGKEEKIENRAQPWVAMTHLFQLRPIGLIMLFLALVQLAVLVVLCIFTPLLFKRGGLRGQPVVAPMGYFACLGFGYIFLMISTMQRFGLILGHPTYSISVIMATFLVVSGLGSLISGRFSLERARGLLWLVAIMLIVMAGLLQVGLPRLAAEALGQPFPVRVLITVAVVSPMAFVMGMCFPTGVRLVARRSEALIPWAYGVNGAASVLGSVVAVVLAMGFGFAKVHWVAAALYVLAALFLGRIGAALANAERLDEEEAPEAA